MQHVRRGLAASLLVGVLALPYVGGFPLAYALILLMLALSVTTTPLPLEPGTTLLLVGYGTLAAAFLLTGELASLANFLVLALALPAAASLRRLARPGNTERVTRLAAAGCGLALVVAVAQIASGFHRPEGYFSDSLWATAAVLTLGFIVLANPETAMKQRNGFVLAVAAAQLVVSLSGSRGPLFAMLLLAIAIPFVATRSWRATLAWCGATALGVIAVQLVWSAGADRLMVLFNSSFQLRAGQEVTDFSIGTRLEFLEAGMRAFLDAPLFGHGWGGMYDAVAPYLDHSRYRLPANRFHLHNDVVNFAVSGGLAGLAAYGAIIAAPLVGALASPLDTQHRMRLGSASALALSYLLCGLTNTMFGFEFTTVLYAALCAVILGYCRDAA